MVIYAKLHMHMTLHCCALLFTEAEKEDYKAYAKHVQEIMADASGYVLPEHATVLHSSDKRLLPVRWP